MITDRLDWDIVTRGFHVIATNHRTGATFCDRSKQGIMRQINRYEKLYNKGK